MVVWLAEAQPALDQKEKEQTKTAGAFVLYFEGPSVVLRGIAGPDQEVGGVRIWR